MILTRSMTQEFFYEVQKRYPNTEFGIVQCPAKSGYDILLGFRVGAKLWRISHEINRLDISNATIIEHKRNIALFWRRRDISLPVLKYDKGDLEILTEFFPKPVYQSCSANLGDNLEI